MQSASADKKEDDVSEHLGQPRQRQLGAQVTLPSGPASNPRLQLAFARLAWLDAAGKLRGPSGQATVLEELKRDLQWRPFLDARQLVLP